MNVNIKTIQPWILFFISTFIVLLAQPAHAATFVTNHSAVITRSHLTHAGRVITHESIPEQSVTHACHSPVTYHGSTSTPEVCDIPEPEPEPTAPTLTFVTSTSSIKLGSSATLTWESQHADVCIASDEWSGTEDASGELMVSPTESTEYTLTCSGSGGTTSGVVLVTVQVDPDPTPLPTQGHMVISEVQYDLAQDGSQGSEVGGANEWVELYNASDSPVDLKQWEIGNGSSNDVITTDTYILESGEFIVITNATSTAQFWDVTNVAVLYLRSSISGGLSNTGDVVALFDNTGTQVDTMSYGNNTDAFSPSIPTVSPGHSIQRVSLATDTDTAADWSENEIPNPGS